MRRNIVRTYWEKLTTRCLRLNLFQKGGTGPGVEYPPLRCHVIQEEVYHPDWNVIPEGVYPPKWNIILIELVNKFRPVRKSIRIWKLG